MTSDRTTGPDQDPPITEGQLVQLFQAARHRVDPSPLLTATTATSVAVRDALDDVLAAVGTAGPDDHTHYQLTHVFDALKSVIAKTVGLHETAEPERPAAYAGTAEQRSAREKITRKLAAIADPDGLGWEAEPADATAVTPLLPDRTALVASVLDAVEEALGNVEKAFDRRPPRHPVPPPPWYRGHLVLEVIQDLMGEASRENAEETWQVVDRLKALLGLEGVQILSYVPGDGAERQADAFIIEDYAKRQDGRFVTDVPALVETGAEVTRKILIRGRVLRLPAEDALQLPAEDAE
jgi:hypothetical protein